MNVFGLLLLLLLPLAGVGYVAWHVWVLLPFGTLWRALVVGLGILCFLTLFLDFTGRLDLFPMPLARALYNIGTSSLILLLYLAMLFIVADLGRLCGWVPRSWLYANGWVSLGVLVTMIGIFTYGFLHYRQKVRVELELTSAKTLDRPYRMVMASDLHLGYHNDRKELARWVDMINAEHPDLILIAGDIIDVSVRPLIEEDMAAEFHRLQAPVYACLGNHEYYAREPKARQFYKDAGIRLLRDETLVIDSALVIVGRDDRTNPNRSSLAQLMQGVDTTKYVVLLDHQPHDLAETGLAGVDFQFSGHTHRGQVWPISWITDAIYECSWGSHQRSNTRYYVSSGLGIWGARFRIGTQSEYVVATIRTIH